MIFSNNRLVGDTYECQGFSNLDLVILASTPPVIFKPRFGFELLHIHMIISLKTIQYQNDLNIIRSASFSLSARRQPPGQNQDPMEQTQGRLHQCNTASLTLLQLSLGIYRRLRRGHPSAHHIVDIELPLPRDSQVMATSLPHWSVLLRMMAIQCRCQIFLSSQTVVRRTLHTHTRHGASLLPMVNYSVVLSLLDEGQSTDHCSEYPTSFLPARDTYRSWT